MKLVEVVRPAAVRPEVFATATAFARDLGKVPVESGVCDGFIGNRILTRYRQAMDLLLLEGALPWEVDAAMEGFGMAMGPYAVQDLSGLEIAWAGRQRMDVRARDDWSLRADRRPHGRGGQAPRAQDRRRLVRLCRRQGRRPRPRSRR